MNFRLQTRVVSSLLVLLFLGAGTKVSFSTGREVVREFNHHPSNNNPISVLSEPVPEKLSFEEVASGLSSPVFITHAGDGSNRIFVIERGGRIRIIKDGNLLTTPFLDFSPLPPIPPPSIPPLPNPLSGEQGLLGLAFDPDYESNGQFYVSYTAVGGSGSILTLARFTVSADADQANPESGTIILTINHPTHSNHNGGTLLFGPDGYLYWSTGDGGGGGDPDGNAQNRTSRLGKILRIDVHGTPPYAIPPTNPYHNHATYKKEIWAYGLRNPWRISFDRLTGDLYIGDVGQGSREEINFQNASSTGGENYGWSVMEGTSCFNPSSGCNTSNKVLPIAQYSHSLGCSVTGGYVYRGINFPSLYGYYFYGDFCTGRLFAIQNNGSAWASPWNEPIDTPYQISTFGEDEQEELYLADYGAGKIYKFFYLEIPIVRSIGLADSNPTAKAEVNFVITFSDDVTGVTIDDFSMTSTGVTGASIISSSGSGKVYNVTVNTGTGSGKIHLDLIDNDSIVNNALIPLGGAGNNNGDFTSGPSYVIIKKTARPTVPKIPLSFANLITNNNTPNLSWVGSSLASQYEIVIATDKGFSSTILTETTSIESFTPGTPLTDGKYYWHVRGLNDILMASAFSKIQVLTIDTAPPVQPVLTSPMNTATLRKVSAFRWTKVSDIILYELQIDDNNAFSSPVIATTNASSRNAPPLQSGHYYWRVRGKDAAGNWSDWSTYREFTIN